MIDNKHDSIDQNQFEFVQADSKIYDKKFETKPIGYFKDAMIRFGKNRTNVVATTILFTIILASAILPIVSNKNVDDLDAGYSNLPPRIPLLENIGIADGTTYRDSKPVDLITVGTLEDYPGLGLPVNVDFAISSIFHKYPETVQIYSYLVQTQVYYLYEIGKQKLKVFISADNILDEQYQVIYGYPMPGKKIETGIEWGW